MLLSKVEDKKDYQDMVIELYKSTYGPCDCVRTYCNPDGCNEQHCSICAFIECDGHSDIEWETYALEWDNMGRPDLHVNLDLLEYEECGDEEDCRDCYPIVYCMRCNLPVTELVKAYVVRSVYRICVECRKLPEL